MRAILLLLPVVLYTVVVFALGFGMAILVSRKLLKITAEELKQSIGVLQGVSTTRRLQSFGHPLPPKLLGFVTAMARIQFSIWTWVALSPLVFFFLADLEVGKLVRAVPVVWLLPICGVVGAVAQFLFLPLLLIGETSDAAAAPSATRVDYLRAALSGLVWIILLFGFAYAALGLREGSAITYSYRTGVYFSVVSFATVGYGDVVPVGLARALASVEILLGYFTIPLMLTALFILLQRHAHPFIEVTDETQGKEFSE
jgi:hypothetical protein